MSDILQNTAVKQSGVEALKIIKTTAKQMLASSVIVLKGMRKSCVEISFALLPFDCLGGKESQDFLMPRVAGLQQIDLHPGTAYS